MSQIGELTWSFGLKNNGNFLTAEAFGFRLNCSSKVMKKKQIFSMEVEDGKTFIRTHLNRYLSFKADGKVTADAEGKGVDEAVNLVTQDGKIVIVTARGFLFGGKGEALDAFTKKMDEDRAWTLQLAIHPQVCIRHVTRKRYIHVSGEKSNQMTTDEDLPWGSDPLVTINSFEDGRYALQTDAGSFLSFNGELKAQVDESCKYSIEFSKDDVGKILFKGSNNKYLTALGAAGTLKATRDEASRDDLFALEDSQPQFKLKNIKWAKFASVKVSLEVQCNQSVAGDTEFFQFEIDQASKKWSIRASSGLFWTCGLDGSIKATTELAQRGDREWFSVSWQGPRLCLTACNGKLVTVKANGACAAMDSVPSDENTFQFEIINRPKLVLRGEHGFVGALAQSGALDCGKSMAEVFTMHVAAGICHISASNGKFWTLEGDQARVAATSASPVPFTMEFVEHSKVAIRAPNGLYVQGQSNGAVGATGATIDASTLWEY